MSVWFCIPSARPAAEADQVLSLWRKQGYKIALWRDDEATLPFCDLVLAGEYPGYARAVNALVSEVLTRDPECSWVVTGGDDIEPDPIRTAEDIALGCAAHFSGTFGVMQPTGDRWANGSIDRICGSPWMGREFCQTMYRGNGPLFEGYSHMFVDEELQEVAIRLGVLWQRLDLTHLHRHFLRSGEDVNHVATVPDHLVRWNTSEHWRESGGLFQSRKAKGFPGHEPLQRAAA